MMRRLAVGMLSLLVWSAAPAAQAACTLSFSALNFGTYTGLLETGANTGTVNCDNGTTYTISLNAGAGAGATETLRKMTGPVGATLNYQIFQDAARTVNWGNTDGVDNVSGTGTGGAQKINVYSQVVAGQLVKPGTYTDTISTATTSFTVTAIVQATCILSTTPLAFGTYAGVLSNSTSTLTMTCTNSTTYNVGLSAGAATGATVTNRSMTGPVSALLGYKLFSNSGRTTNWGNTVGTDTVAGSGSGIAQPLTVYGQIPAGQYVRPGSYGDTIVATITY
jgi:spore coat protein U-like protein